MAQTRLHDDANARVYQDSIQLGGADYNMKRSYWMREQQKKCYPDGRGVMCSMYGPFTGDLVTRDSYLNGRGQPLSGCGGCQVRWLPEELFDSSDVINDSWGELTQDMRSADVCDSIAEQDATQYSLMPRGFQDNFTLIFGASGRGIDRDNFSNRNAANRANQQEVTSYGYYPQCPCRK